MTNPNEPVGGDQTNEIDDTDVEAALQRETQDGKGDEEPGDSDFESYATEGVEKENTP